MIFPFIGLDAVTVLTTLFWIWMLIDCVFTRPKKSGGGIKLFWFLFILFTHIVGALIYFFVECSHQNPVDAFAYYYHYITNAFGQKAQSMPNQQQTPPPAPPQYYSDYQQGYQAKPQQSTHAPAPVTTVQTVEAELETDHPQPQYEQPMVLYPEMPQP